MIIPFEKLVSVKDNKYIFTKALMYAVDKIGNMKEYPEENLNWKVVPNVIRLMMEDKIKYKYIKKDEEPEKK